jgi:RNA polymerase sigma factor (sigma-70 family)
LLNNFLRSGRRAAVTWGEISWLFATLQTLEAEIKRMYPTWRRYARGLIGSQAKGDDCLNETLLKLLENQREKAEELAKLGTLEFYVNRALYLMATDSSSRYHVKYSKFGRKWDCESTRHLGEPVPVWMGSRVDNEYLDAYISLMPELDAVVLRLYMFEDFSYKEASRVTGIPVKELYRLVENAINKIKKNVHRTPINSSPAPHDVSGL